MIAMGSPEHHPEATCTAKTVGQVIPKLNLTGMAFTVAIPNVSINDLTCLLERPATYDGIKKVINQILEG